MQQARCGMSREFWIAVRQALLMFLDALERELQISPRTAELRKQGKESTILSTPQGSGIAN